MNVLNSGEPWWIGTRVILTAKPIASTDLSVTWDELVFGWYWCLKPSTTIANSVSRYRTNNSKSINGLVYAAASSCVAHTSWWQNRAGSNAATCSSRAQKQRIPSIKTYNAGNWGNSCRVAGSVRGDWSGNHERRKAEQIPQGLWVPSWLQLGKPSTDRDRHAEFTQEQSAPCDFRLRAELGRSSHTNGSQV